MTAIEMTLEEAKKLIASGESESVEFKKSTSLLSDAFEIVCPFLNGDGGTVLVGVSEKGKITGQDVSDNTRREIAKEINKLEPCAKEYIHVDYIPIENEKKIIAISVAPGCHVPYAYDGRAFLRNQSTTSRMPQHQYEQLMIKRGHLKHSWESFVAEGCSLKDLDEDTIWMIVNEAIRAKRLHASVLKENTQQILQ